MRTSGDGDDGAGLRRRGGQHARDGAGGGGHVLLLRKIVHALLCFLALSSPSLWRENGWAQKKPQKRTTREEKWRRGGSFRRHGIVHQRRKTDGYAPAFPPSLFARHLPLFLLLLLNRASTALHAVAPLNRNEETSSSSAQVDKIDPSFSQATTRMSAPSWCCELRGLFAVGAITEVKGAPNMIPLCPYVF